MSLLLNLALCVFPVSHGEALTFEPLLSQSQEQSSLRDLCIVAVATVTQVLCLLQFVLVSRSQTDVQLYLTEMLTGLQLL